MAKWRRRANVRSVSFIISSVNDDEGLTFEASASWSNRQVTTKSERSKRQLRYLFTVEVWPSSTRLIPNFRVSIPQRRAAPQFPYNLQRSFVYKKCTHRIMSIWWIKVSVAECTWTHHFFPPLLVTYFIEKSILSYFFFFLNFECLETLQLDGDIARFLWSRKMGKWRKARVQGVRLLLKARNKLPLEKDLGASQ